MNPSSAAFFEAKYRAVADPWNFVGSTYEQGRYRATLEALGGQRFRRALEPGCSVGVLTERLASLCDEVDAFDFSPTAAEAARARCAPLGNVAVRCAALTAELPFREYDLIVLSEIGYYFSRADWSDLAAKLTGSMAPGATLLAVHWTGVSADHQLSGETVHAVLAAQPEMTPVKNERHAEFLLASWRRA